MSANPMDILESIISAIYPPKCLVCQILIDNSKDYFCPECKSAINWLDTDFFNPEMGSPSFTSAKSLAAHEGAWGDVIHQFKYNERTDLAKPLALMMAEKIHFEYDLIVSVPLHYKRLRERGYNQSALLAKSLAKLTGFRCEYDILKRVKETPPQVGLTKEERLDNVKGAFECDGETDTDILLIDDVMTTGATVNECAKVLKKCGAARVDVLTLARRI